MKKAMLCCVIAVGVSLSASAQTYCFSDPTSVNLLERWLPGTEGSPAGVYYYDQTMTNWGGQPIALATTFRQATAGMYGYGLNDATGPISATIDFGKPVQLSEVTLGWQGGHVPEEWWVYGDGVLIGSGNAWPVLQRFQTPQIATTQMPTGDNQHLSRSVGSTGENFSIVTLPPFITFFARPQTN